MTISTVTPVYNGARYLPELLASLDSYRSYLAEKNAGISLAESIFVVDDAIDSSERVLREQEKQYEWLKLVVLSRNFGQHPATIAGILHSSGDWVVTLDEDLQHRPQNITDLLYKAISEQSDLVYAKPKENVHKSLVKDFLARTFKRFTARLMNNPHVKDFNSFRLIRGSVARAAGAICRHETYLDVALGWFTKRVSAAEMNLVDQRNQSSDEESGYSVWGLVRHAKRMLMSSKIKLLRVGIPIGVFAFLVSTVVSLYALMRKIATLDTTVGKGWASTILAILFFGGLTVMLLGLLLEIISDIVLSINGKPTFFVVDRRKDAYLSRALEILKGDS